MALVKIKSWKLYSILCMLLLLSSCYSPEDGCLDPEAVNYSITADNDCDDCCTYPVISISIFHENKDTTFDLLDTIINDLDQQISLVDFVYLLSDFEFVNEGVEIEVVDSVSLDTDDGTTIVKDDIIRVSRDRFTYDVGTIIYDGKTENISFRIGLSDELNGNRFTTEIEDHPLTTDPDTLFNEMSDTYVFQRIQVAQGVDFLDTVVYNVSVPFDISFEIDVISTRGENKNIVIEAQYDRWFDGIDFESMTYDQISEKIAENSANLLRVEQ